MGKLALKGLRGMRLWPVDANTEDTYTTGTMLLLPSAQGLTKEVTRGDYTIYADDEVYDTGADYQYEELELTLAELPIELEATLSGGEFDATEKTYTFKNTDVAPEFALGYAALNSSGGYRMFKHYLVRVLSIKVDHTTKGDSNDIAPYTVTIRNTQRKADGSVRQSYDGDGPDLTWLNTIDQIETPAEGG